MNAKRILMVLVVIGLALPVMNLIVGVPVREDYAGLPAATPSLARAKEILGAKCVMCHSEDPALPFYASLPVAGPMMSRHVKDGTAIHDIHDLVAAEGRQEVALAKLEQSLELDTMPILPYMLLHWNGALTGAEKADLLAWIREVRAAAFASGRAAPPFAAHAVQPLPERWPEELSPKMVALGEKLYNDKRLSGDDTISCASCHDLAKGGTDQIPFSIGIRDQLGGINAPTVFNAVFNFVQFWDGRAKDLVAQAGGPPLNPIEMGATWEQVTGKLTTDAQLTALHAEVYGDQPWSEASITRAIAEFEKTLVTPDSPLDQYLMGKADALSPEAVEGYDLFVRHSCATCHVGKPMGGQSYEKPLDPVAFYKELGREPKDGDFGRFNETKDAADWFMVKVPLLRNIAITFPYLHDGSQTNLADVVGIMARHFVPELNLQPMGDADVRKIVAMLNANTGKLHGKSLAP